MAKPHNHGATNAARKDIVEIGRLNRPIWCIFDKLPLEDQVYHGLDMSSLCPGDKGQDRQKVAASKLAVEARNKDTRYKCQYGPLNSNGKIALKNSSVSEVYLSLVISDPLLSISLLATVVDESARILGSRGPLIWYNDNQSRSRGVAIDYSTGKISFKSGGFHYAQPADGEDQVLVRLKARFKPMGQVGYAQFLSERGLESRKVPPDLAISIFERLS